MFKCKEKCGECCGPVPIPKEIWERNKHKAQPHKHEITDGTVVFAFTEKLNCAFLKDYKCLIYEDRPDICSNYGVIEKLPCSYLKPNGEERKLWETKIIKAKVNQEYDLVIRVLGENIGSD